MYKIKMFIGYSQYQIASGCSSQLYLFTVVSFSGSDASNTLPWNVSSFFSVSQTRGSAHVGPAWARHFYFAHPSGLAQ